MLGGILIGDGGADSLSRQPPDQEAWPDKTIAVGVSRIQEARWLVGRLRKYLSRVNVLGSRNQAADDAGDLDRPGPAAPGDPEG
jgi:hypothetical protein